MAGAEIGPYRLKQEIGHGGMGAVWLAERTDGSLKRPVALKLLHRGFHGRQFAERFGRERDILAGLTHPNIARLYDAGITTDAQPFLVLEYVRRRNIDRLLRSAMRLMCASASIFSCRCSTPSSMRIEHLVVHRDLKPGNILVNNEGQIRLLDFGIAKLMVAGQREANETELTRLGGRAHTPDYASPEQVAGAPITTASDIYSLGVVLYELLSGKRPYKLPRQSSAALEEAILSADPPPPSRVVGADTEARNRGTTHRGLVRELKGDLDTIPFENTEEESGGAIRARRWLTIFAGIWHDPIGARPDRSCIARRSSCVETGCRWPRPLDVGRSVYGTVHGQSRAGRRRAAIRPGPPTGEQAVRHRCAGPAAPGQRERQTAHRGYIAGIPAPSGRRG